MVTDTSPVQLLKAKYGFTDPSPTFSELDTSVDNYILSCQGENKSLLTISSYRQRLSVFRTFLKEQGIKKPGAITGYYVRLFLLSLQEQKLAPATLNVYYRILKTFFNWLEAEGIIKQDKNPMHNIKPPRIPSKLPQPFSKQDIENLLKVTANKRFTDIRNRALVLPQLHHSISILKND